MTSQRAVERVRVDAFVKIVGEDSEVVFRTRDLSEQGLFLYTTVTQAYPYKVGSTLELDVDGIQCRVVVVRIVEPGTPESESFPTGFGVRIVEITEDARTRIRALVERVKNA